MAFKSSDFLVEGLEHVEPAFANFNGKMYAGLLPTSIDDGDDDDQPDATGGNLMFWLFESTDDDKNDNGIGTNKDSLTIWFNGGPGCSSFQGGLFENAPVTTSHHPAGYAKTTAYEPFLVNDWAWTKVTNIMYVEMPHGTGFSSGQQPNNETELSTYFYNFLIHFYDTFPDMQTKSLYLFGESYAGMYVPSIAHYIHQRNKQTSPKKNEENVISKNTFINLKGIGLGNAWMDAKIQGPMVIDYAWWHGMIDSTTRETLHRAWKVCRKEDTKQQGQQQEDGTNKESTTSGINQPPFHPFTVPDECNIMGAVLQAAGSEVFPKESYHGPNTYDVTTWDIYPLLFNDESSTLVDFFNNPLVKKALHAPTDIAWHGCIPGAGRRTRRMVEDKEEEDNDNGTTSKTQLPGLLLLANDEPRSMIPYLEELLDETSIRVLVYNGDRDMSTCSQGSETLLNQLSWKGSNSWPTATRGVWLVNREGKIDGENSTDMEDKIFAGYVKSVQNLDYVQVYNSGHLVPSNVPVAALDLITRFVNEESYLDVPLPRFDHLFPSHDDIESTAIKTVIATTGRSTTPGGGVVVDKDLGYSLFIVSMVGVIGFLCGIAAAAAAYNNKRNNYLKRKSYRRILDQDESENNTAI